jgi:phospholipase C
MGSLEKIAHVVVLMLENRSFDGMLGRLYPKSPSFDGLDGTESNPDKDGAPIAVWSRSGGDVMRVPDPDPGELWTDINVQIFGRSDVADPPPAARMQGFVRSYQQQTAAPPASYRPASVMHYFTPEQVPVLSALARHFTVSDRWHASAPCQTWPNRFFAHTGTAAGYVDNDPPHFPYEMPTIFERFDAIGRTDGWKIYFHDVPQSLTLSRLWPHLERFRLYDEFRYDAERGTLPAYAFIEPRYFADLALPNDQHPPHVVSLGEQLIADVYNCLRNGPAWTSTLLIITHDEHGGSFDHVAPPPARPPSPSPTRPFNFDRYGVRVPAVLVSPYVRAGTVLRPPGKAPFDHTSIIKTLRLRFGLGAALSERDEAAPDLAGALQLDRPDNMGPSHIGAPAYVASPAEIATARQKPPNSLQRALLHLAAHLPDSVAAVPEHIALLRRLKAADEQIVADLRTTVGDAAHVVKSELGKLFATL